MDAIRRCQDCVGAIVLAAGRSRRMGTQKLLLPFDGRPLIARVVDEVLHCSVDRVVVVVSNEGQWIRDALREYQVDFATNEDAEAEMLSSVRRGLIALDDRIDAALIVLGDQPRISRSIVTEMIRAFQAADRGIVVPVYEGRRGHPILMSMHYRNEILARHDGRGLRGVLESHPEDVLELPVTTSGILEDIDTPEEYRRVLNEST